MSGVALVQFSALDLAKVLPLARASLGRSISEAADSIDSNPPLHHMLCIASVKEPNLRASADACKPYLNLFHAGFLVAADERDFAEIFEIAGLPCILVESQERGIGVSFMAGTLSQWRDAVMRGCVKEASREARKVYNQIYGEFKKLGLTNIFEARQQQHPLDHTFYLEHHK